MAANTFRVWPASKANCERRFEMVADGEKGFLRIYPSDDPSNATVISEKDLDHVVFLTASTSTFERNRILLIMKTPQKWDYVSPGSETVFAMVYCRSDDYETTAEQDQKALDFVTKLQNNYLDEQSFVVEKKKKTLDGKAVATASTGDSEDKLDDEFVKEIEAAGTDMIQGMVIENINNAIADLYKQLTEAFVTVSFSIVDPDDQNSFFASFTKGDVPYHLVSSVENDILLAIHAAILCHRYVLINMNSLATVVFHRTNGVESTLRGTEQTSIYFIYKATRMPVCVKSLNEIDTGKLLMYLQNQESVPVVCCQLSQDAIPSEQLDRLRKLTFEDRDRLFEGKPAVTDAQKCLKELELELPEESDDDDMSSDGDRSDDEDWQEET